MNEKQYNELCEACDQLLLASDSTTERVAIPWLHIIREHPVILRRYESLFNEDSIASFSLFVENLHKVARNIAWWGRQIIRSIFYVWKPWHITGDLPAKIDILFVSHLLNASQAGEKNDFYYGILPDEMNKNGYSSAITLINYSKKSGSSLIKKWDSISLVPRIIFSNSLGFMKDFKFVHRMFVEMHKLKALASRQGNTFEKSLVLKASKEALSRETFSCLRMALQIAGLVERLKPKVIVVTHEGHAWERVAFAAARNALPGIKCLGYQHAAIFQRQHAIRRNLAVQYNPDLILTAGEVGKEQLKHFLQNSKIPVSVLGSPRVFVEQKNKLGSVENLESKANALSPACLVLPEGLVSECNLMFEFSIECAKRMPGVQFIWRLHPIINFDALLRQNPKLRNLPGNIILSNVSLVEDTKRCKWALYRGTTAIVQTIVAGLRPVYLKIPGEMTIDPVYDLIHWRKIISNVSELEKVIRYDQPEREMDKVSEIKLAQEYCRKFFTPMDTGVFAAALKGILP